MSYKKSFPAAMVFCLLLGIAANAATRTWSGAGGNSNWSTAANWMENITPTAGDDLVFPANAAQFTTNDNLGAAFNSIRIQGGNYTLTSSAFQTLVRAGGITVEAGTHVFNMRVSLQQSAVFNAVAADATATFLSVAIGANTLTIDGGGQQVFGLISGAGNVVKQGIGIALFIGPSSYSGTTTVSNGILVVDGNQPNSPINIAGGVLAGTGTTGAVNVNLGAVTAGSLSAPTGTLNTRNLTFNGDTSVFLVKLSGTAAGSFDQINVAGTVNLNGGDLLPISFNNFIPAVGDMFRIINNDGTDAVSGTFFNLPENGLLVMPGGLSFRITYRGGDGNDVVLTRVAYAPFDFDGDGKSDVSVFRPSDGTWYVLGSQSGFFARQWGANGDRPVPADYDGDGRTDFAVFRGGVWYVLRSSDGAFQATQFGLADDKPVPADYDGDSRADIAVFRQSTGVWYSLRSSTGAFEAVNWGTNGDVPVPADYDLDGRTDVAVFRAGVWYLRSSLTGLLRTVNFGLANDIPIPGDYDYDGVPDVAVYRPAPLVGAVSAFYWLRSTDNVLQGTQWGTVNDIPTPADYDGDGRIDISVFRPSNGTWYHRPSSPGGFSIFQFGTNGDKPVPASFLAYQGN